jgi:alanine dehydrogenase
LNKAKQHKALLLSRKQVESVLKLKDVIKAVEDAYREIGSNTARVPTRIRVDMEAYNGNILVMPAYLSGMDALATKLVTTHLDNPRLNLPTVVGTIIVHDPKTGLPLAIMDGTYITAMRTGAAGAVAARYLSREDSSTVTIVGTGVQGRSQLIALCEVRKIQKAFAFDSDPERCKDYVEEMKKRVTATVSQVTNLQDAVGESDIIVTATPSFQPVVKGEWIKEGCHLTGIGSHSPDARELDENVITKASKVVLDTWDAKKVGDIAYPISKGLFKEEEIYSDIGTIIAGKKPGRTSPTEITVFKSVGTAVIDVATAFKAYNLAAKKGVGRPVDLWGV